MEIWKEIYTCRIRKTKLFSTFYQIQVSTYHCNLATPSIHGGSLEITLTVRVRALFVKQLVFPVIIGDTDFLSSIMLCFLKEIFKNFNFLEFLKEMFFYILLFFVFYSYLFLKKTYFVNESNCIHSPERKIILEPRAIHSTYTSTCRNIYHS